MGVWRAGACLAIILVACQGVADSPWAPEPVEREWVRAEVTTTTPGTRVEVGESIQAAVDAASDGATLVLAPGVHRLQQVDPRPGQVFFGEAGAVVNGAMLLDDFAGSGGEWTHEGVFVEGEERGNCRTSYPACRLPQDLFIDDELIRRVAARDEVDSSTWFLDSEDGRLILGQDPTGRVVELSVLPYAFGGQADNVTLEGLTIEKYAAPGQAGAVAVRRDWSVISCEIRFNHGAGVKGASGLVMRDSYLHHNGQFGISGGGVGVTIEGNEISHNGAVGYSPGWAAGGTKFVQVTNLKVVDNFVHSNLGPGLWTDAGLEGTVYEANRVLNNEHAGIKHEISGSAVISSNEVTGNGFGHSVNLRGAGILVRESGPVDIVSNLVWGNADAVVLLQDDDRENVTGYELTGIEVHDNDIAFGDGQMGFLGDLADDVAGSEVVVESNRYYGEPERLSFVAFGATVDLERWRQETGDDSVVLPSDDMRTP